MNILRMLMHLGLILWRLNVFSRWKLSIKQIKNILKTNITNGWKENIWQWMEVVIIFYLIKKKERKPVDLSGFCLEKIIIPFCQQQQQWNSSRFLLNMWSIFRWFDSHFFSSSSMSLHNGWTPTHSIIMYVYHQTHDELIN